MHSISIQVTPQTSNEACTQDSDLVSFFHFSSSTIAKWLADNAMHLFSPANQFADCNPRRTDGLKDGKALLDSVMTSKQSDKQIGYGIPKIKEPGSQKRKLNKRKKKWKKSRSLV